MVSLSTLSFQEDELFADVLDDAAWPLLFPGIPATAPYAATRAMRSMADAEDKLKVTMAEKESFSDLDFDLTELDVM